MLLNCVVFWDPEVKKNSDYGYMGNFDQRFNHFLNIFYKKCHEGYLRLKIKQVILVTLHYLH